MVVTADGGWTVTLDNAPVSKEDDKFLVDLSSVDSSIESNKQKVVYWNAPKEFLGNQVRKTDYTDLFKITCIMQRLLEIN